MSELVPGDLEALISHATDAKLLQTVALIDRLPSRGALDQMLAPLRPRLGTLKPQRPLSFKRVLTYPLQELLVPAADWQPGSLSLSRELLGTIHELLTAGLDASLQRSVAEALRGRDTRERAILFDIGKRLWPAAAAVLRATIAAAPANGDGKGRNRRQQLELAATLLETGVAQARVFLTLPEKPLRRLDDDQRQLILGLLQELEAAGGAALAIGTEAIGRRLGDPTVLLDLLSESAEGQQSAVRAAAAREATRRVVADLDTQADRLRQGPRRPASALAGEAVDLVAMLDRLEGGSPDLPVDRAALGQVRRKAAKAVEASVQAVVQGEVLEGFRELGGPVDERTIARIEAAARAARKLGAAGRQLGLGGQIDLTLKTALADYRRSLAPANGADADLMDQLRVIEILFGPDVAAELLMSRHQGTLPRVERLAGGAERTAGA